MSVIVIGKTYHPSGYIVPDGGEILWYGDSSIPSGWILDTAINNNFIMGAAEGEASDISAGESRHIHTVPNTSLEPKHGHSRGGFTTAPYALTADEYQAAGRPGVGVPNHDHTVPAGILVGEGEHDHVIPDTSDSNNLPPYKLYYWIIADGDQEVPIGGIVFWDKLIELRPEGFNICDGETYDGEVTPDLREYFVYGANSDLTIGNSGGALTHEHSLEDDDLPAGEHNHGAGGSTYSCASKDGGWQGVYVQSIHAHSLSGTTTTKPNHVHGFDSNTGAANHLPLYIKLFMIMRTV